ncbi:DUF503 domain-containing protein [Marinitoga aeolica]|uniref:DUF503 domain-containing protein n=1 Tax=Marinitoga aeolica TaxID=2809031 RepID=A0ABY8PRY9_9BACT|nr:DUF503 domain-containing protein [Marinitoga aeolica]WGS65404.1 DUF503 domain-containing protein [Marinitoga aeolica]
MRILVATYQVELVNINSLKEKRSIIKKIINDFRKKYNIAIVESDFNDSKKFFEITVVTLSQNRDFLLNFFEKLEDEIEYKYGLNLVISNYEII